ncbi:MAG: hypothetical protein KKE17_03595 [Proteobacteria bacterium]|nr:hypothetical protein [Pseudomonadota bacterium]MBU1709068.1 hypothetical protein [Pseudomonadota bacterium]
MNNSHTPHTLAKWVINLFFCIGVLSAIAFRALIVVNHFDPALFRPLWYVGVIGYIFFFFYRYVISEKRKKAIEQFGLIEKLQENSCLDDQDRDVVIYLLSSIRKSRENYNYLFIFIFSALAVLADIILSS